jgi:hypothetical protein
MLPSRGALGEQRVELGRERPLAQSLGPPVRDLCQRRVQLLPQLLDERRERVGEVPVAALAERVPRHHDGAAEPVVLVEHRDHVCALLGGQQRRGACDAVGVEALLQGGDVQSVEHGSHASTITQLTYVRWRESATGMMAACAPDRTTP